MTNLIKGLIPVFFFSMMLSGCLPTNVAPQKVQETSFISHPGYERIDKHALNTPKRVENSLSKLAAYLIEPAKNDREKVRAIYRWMTHNIAYDDQGFFSGHTGDLSPDGVLKSRRAVCDGYAGLFKLLGQAAGLEVENISGYSKGYSYSVEGTDSINHAWNAVKIDGQWQLIDTTWGAGYLDEKAKRFVRQFQDHYFLTPPEQFIYDHFPKQARWQLLKPPISKSEYDKRVYLRPAFFRTGLTVGSHPQGTINTRNQVTIVLKAPKNAVLTAKLLLDNRYEVEQSHTAIRQKAGQYEIRVTFPRPGEYTLRLFTKRQSEPGAYRWALDYRIIASEGMADEEQAVSPEQIFFDTGLKVDSHPRRLIKTEKQVLVTLFAPADVLMSAVLYKNNKRLDKSLTLVQKKGEQYEIHTVFPQPGDYLLRLFAKHKSDADYQQALDYTVKVNQGMSGKIGFPKTFAPFKENQGYLYTPKQAHLRAGTKQSFKLAISADKVAVLIGEKWHHLEKQGNIFEGKVTIGMGKFSVYAKWSGNRSYSSLLEYVGE